MRAQPNTIFKQLKGMIKNPSCGIPKRQDPFNVEMLKKYVQKDNALSNKQKETVFTLMRDPQFLDELRSGAVGAGLAYLITNYLKLSPHAQILLSLAGFGIGKLIYDYKSNPNRFSEYNNKINMYEIR